MRNEDQSARMGMRMRMRRMMGMMKMPMMPMNMQMMGMMKMMMMPMMDESSSFSPAPSPSPFPTPNPSPSPSPSPPPAQGYVCSNPYDGGLSNFSPGNVYGTTNDPAYDRYFSYGTAFGSLQLTNDDSGSSNYPIHGDPMDITVYSPDCDTVLDSFTLLAGEMHISYPTLNDPVVVRLKMREGGTQVNIKFQYNVSGPTVYSQDSGFNAGNLTGAGEGLWSVSGPGDDMILRNPVITGFPGIWELERLSPSTIWHCTAWNGQGCKTFTKFNSGEGPTTVNVCRVS